MKVNRTALFVCIVLVLSNSAFAQNKPVAVYVTARHTKQRLSNAGSLSWIDLPQPTERQQCVFVDPSKTFQTVVGIGGALTDAAAETYYKLPPEKRSEVLKAYYDKENGIGYTLARTQINSCDFSSASYTYVKDDDKELASFDIAPDLKYRVPFIKEVLAAAGNDLKIFASPWSPPAWMKDNDDMLHGGSLKPDCYDAWAHYYVKFIKAYESEGIPIWGLTVQNEPMAVQKWESCVYTAQQERDFVKNNLGPALWDAGYKDKKLMIWDHNRSMMYQRAQVVLDDPEAAKYVWGLGFHWYVGDFFENVARVAEAYPKINLVFTEGCNGPFSVAHLDDWDLGENYGKSMINDFNNGAVGWTDWNILLDMTGGPNHVRNFCFAPIHGDTKTGALHYGNSFYYIGHLSKFIRPGARRIISSSTLDQLLTTAFVNPDGKIAVVVMNATDESEPYYLWMDGKAARTTSPAHSIMTLVCERP
jgi:glucosylceramidase